MTLSIWLACNYDDSTNISRNIKDCICLVKQMSRIAAHTHTQTIIILFFKFVYKYMYIYIYITAQPK
jgi:hypothetical protein